MFKIAYSTKYLVIFDRKAFFLFFEWTENCSLFKTNVFLALSVILLLIKYSNIFMALFLLLLATDFNPICHWFFLCFHFLFQWDEFSAAWCHRYCRLIHKVVQILSKIIFPSFPLFENSTIGHVDQPKNFNEHFCLEKKTAVNSEKRINET